MALRCGHTEIGRARRKWSNCGKKPARYMLLRVRTYTVPDVMCRAVPEGGLSWLSAKYCSYLIGSRRGNQGGRLYGRLLIAYMENFA